MARVIDDLLVVLGFRADTDGADRFDNRLGGIIKTVGKVGAVMTGMSVAVGGALAKVAIDTAEAVDETKRLADVADVTASELQRLTVGAERYGIEQEKLADILKDVSDKTGDYIASGGGEMADFFDNVGNKVGVTADAFKDLSSSDALQLYVTTLEEANVSQAEMTFYMEKMASDSTLLLPLLEDNGKGFKKWGDEAERAGVLMSEADFANSVDLIDNLKKSKLIYKGLILEITKKATPFVNKALEWIIDNQAQIRATAESIADGFRVAIDAVSDAYQFIGDKIKWIDDNSQNLINTLKVIGGVAAVIASALLLMYGPAIAGFILMQATGILSFLLLQGAAIASAVATGAAWLIAFAPFLLIVAVIAVVIGLLWLVYDNWAAISAGIKVEWDKLTLAFNMGIAAIRAWWSDLMSSISDAFSSVVTAITGIWQGLWDGIKSIASGVIDGIIDRVQSIITMVVGAINKVKELAKYSPSNLVTGAKDWLSSTLGGGGSSNSDNSVSQVINVKSTDEANMIANGSITNAMRKNTNGYS